MRKLNIDPDRKVVKIVFVERVSCLRRPDGISPSSGGRPAARPPARPERRP